LLRTATEAIRIAVRTILVTGFLGAFAVLLSAGTTATTLGPRWLGIVLLILAAVALVLALRELRVVWRLRLAQVRRRRAERLSTREL
jgi:protein-S-isoprenylcysteine O-methyltransferase Ste14